MYRKNTITRSEFEEIGRKLDELINLVEKYEHLYLDVDDLTCLADSLTFLELGKFKDLKIVD